MVELSKKISDSENAKPRVLQGLANQVSGQKIIYTDEEGSICKQATGNELIFYQLCQSEENMKPFSTVTPKMLQHFKLRKDVDKINLVIDGKTIEASSLAIDNDRE